MSFSHNLLLAIACVCVAGVATASILSGHDGLELALSVIVMLSAGVPPAVSALFPKGTPTTSGVPQL